MIHGAVGDLEVFEIGLWVALEFEDHRRWRYASCLLSVLPDEQRAIFKGALTVQQQYELTEVERRSVAFHDGRREGKLEGEMEGKREVLRTIAELRQLVVEPAAAHRIDTCTSAAHLERWIARAKRIDVFADVFEEV